MSAKKIVGLVIVLGAGGIGYYVYKKYFSTDAAAAVQVPANQVDPATLAARAKAVDNFMASPFRTIVANQIAANPAKQIV